MRETMVIRLTDGNQEEKECAAGLCEGRYYSQSPPIDENMTIITYETMQEAMRHGWAFTFQNGKEVVICPYCIAKILKGG